MSYLKIPRCWLVGSYSLHARFHMACEGLSSTYDLPYVFRCSCKRHSFVWPLASRRVPL